MTGVDAAYALRGHGHVALPGVVFGDGLEPGSVAVNSVAYCRVPYTGRIVGWQMCADVAVTCTIDVWKKAAAIPTVADTIVASAKPTITAAVQAASAEVRGWSTIQINAGDILGFCLDSLSGGAPKMIALDLMVER